jgi:sugar phosphate isomerase/epimerase
MRPIGFSTGALALGDFERALELLRGRAVEVVELSALRERELAPLVEAAPRLALEQFRHVAVHAPSRIEPGHEPAVVEQLAGLAARGWPVVVHPDAVSDWALWRLLGARLLVENMDRRKTGGRTAGELAAAFDRVPEAGLCLDVGHAHQQDPTMAGARLILERLGDRLREVHLSHVTGSSAHERLGPAAIAAARAIAALIPEHVPVVLETPVTEEQLDEELRAARAALG